MFFCWAFQLEFMPTQILWSTQNLCSTPYLWHDALRTNNLHSKDWYGWLRSLILWWIKAAMSRHCSPGDVTVAKVGKRPCKYNWNNIINPLENHSERMAGTSALATSLRAHASSISHLREAVRQSLQEAFLSLQGAFPSLSGNSGKRKSDLKSK